MRCTSADYVMVPDGKEQSTQTRAAFHRRRNRAGFDAVTTAGLTVHSVEITISGSIKIETQPRKQRPSTATTAPDTADVQDKTLKKKQA
jgi:anti-sigma factor RsiW